MVAWALVLEERRSQFLEVNFFDIGQGDTIFITTPQKHQILIDGGPGSSILEKLGQEMPWRDRSLDLVILTHPDHDHMGGLLDVLKSYQVEQILWTGIISDRPEVEAWEDLLKKEGAEIKIAQAGQRFIAPNFYLEILHPQESLAGREFKNINNTSVMVKLVFGNNSFLFTGDAEQSLEKQLVGQSNLDIDVLKVGHHGSKTSTSEELLEKTSPEMAIIQVGENNSYGHPANEVLEKLEKFDIRVLRTDINGDIKIISDGNQLIL